MDSIGLENSGRRTKTASTLYHSGPPFTDPPLFHLISRRRSIAPGFHVWGVVQTGTLQLPAVLANYTSCAKVKIVVCAEKFIGALCIVIFAWRPCAGGGV